MQGPKLTDEEWEMSLASLKARIERNEYVVDPRAVADAIVRRLREHPAASSEDCS